MTPHTVKLVSIVVVVSALPWAAPGAAGRCDSDRMKAAGRYVFCRLKAEAHASRRGKLPDYDRCNSNFRRKLLQVGALGDVDCVPDPDEELIFGRAAECSAGLTAAILGDPSYGGGGELIECRADLASCENNVSACVTDLLGCEERVAVAELCGNGVSDPGEECDFGSPGSETCGLLGYGGGVLSCGKNCSFETSLCWDERFVDNADGTITDRDSGLMWEKKIGLDSVPNPHDPHDADNFYRWSGRCSENASRLCQPNAFAAALCAHHVEGDPIGCGECGDGDGNCTVNPPAITTLWDWLAELNGDNFAGYSDWRVPTLRELQSIIDYAAVAPPVVELALQGASCGSLCVDPTDSACSCTRPGHTWTGSTFAPSPDSLWVVNFGGGIVTVGGKTDYFYSRAVRSVE